MLLKLLVNKNFGCTCVIQAGATFPYENIKGSYDRRCYNKNTLKLNETYLMILVVDIKLMGNEEKVQIKI